MPHMPIPFPKSKFDLLPPPSYHCRPMLGQRLALPPHCLKSLGNRLRSSVCRIAPRPKHKTMKVHP